jgi:co-chaperonin GroES (HSP10)
LISILLHHVLIKLDEPEVKTASGIIISLDEKKERKAVEYGTVLQVGPRAFIDYGRDPSILSKGDRVCINRYSGKEVKDTDGTEYLIVNDQDILCVVNKE